MEEKVIIGKDGLYPLEGILTVPDTGKGKYPAVVFVHGSGPSDKDETVFKIKPFKDLAEGLSKHDIASIRYDKRTYRYSKELRKKSLTINEETIDDALLASEILRNDRRIDKDNIFIVGHSMGAMLAPRIDSEGGNYKGLIMMAGTPHTLEDIMIRQIKQAGNTKNILLKAIVKLEEKIYMRKFDHLYEMSDEQARNTKFAGSLNLYYFKEMGKKTASEYLKDMDKHVLIMQGGKDFQVSLEEDFNEFKRQLKDKDNIEYRLYDNLNHTFVEALYDDILKASKEYSVERHIGEEVIGDIAEFIHRNR